MGRPKGTTKLELNPDLQTRIVTYIQAGAYVETAAAAAGICKDTFYDWLKRGAAYEAPFKCFSDAVQKAAAEAEVRDLAVIDKAARNGTWQAAAWKLERRNPKAWGRRTVIERPGDTEPDPIIAVLAAMMGDDGVSSERLETYALEALEVVEPVSSHQALGSGQLDGVSNDELCAEGEVLIASVRAAR